ncbi:MAG TPA: S-ribosylhomocysteine lyase [Candidatus Merdivicinus intestinavium]|nr:S-ribosylhomocysteine lyase [Candidatus Merdivicinus intestinavium]
MKRIESFCVNHDRLTPGLYLSRVDGDAVTYDLRMVVPNAGTYLDNDGIHTFEHLFATYARNSEYSDRVIYVGPMGCRTGFYLVVRDSISKEEVISLVRRTMDFIAAYEGEIPGATRIECGNYREHSLEKARAYAASMAGVLRDWTPDKMAYLP